MIVIISLRNKNKIRQEIKNNNSLIDYIYKIEYIKTKNKNKK